MKIDRRITNGLAWAGVVLVVGIPTADLLSAQFMGNPGTSAMPQVAVVAPVPAPLTDRPDAPVPQPVAAITPARPVAQPTGAVNDFLQSGRPLPSYITGGGAPTAPTPAPAAQAAVTAPVRTPIVTTPAAPVEIETDPVEVASIPPQKIAPVPMPLSMRPKPVPVAALQSPVFTQPPVVDQQPALIIPPGLTPAPNAPVVNRPPVEVTASDLDDWETGPLSDFLAQRQQQGQGNYIAPQSDYDANGFYLDQGPNTPRNRVIARESDPYLLFAD